MHSRENQREYDLDSFKKVWKKAYTISRNAVGEELE